MSSYHMAGISEEKLEKESFACSLQVVDSVVHVIWMNPTIDSHNHALICNSLCITHDSASYISGHLALFFSVGS